MSDALPTASRFGRRDFLTSGLGIAGGVTLWAGGLTGPATAAGTERAFRRRSRASRSLTTNALLSTTDRPPSTSSWTTHRRSYPRRTNTTQIGVPATATLLPIDDLRASGRPCSSSETC